MASHNRVRSALSALAVCYVVVCAEGPARAAERSEISFPDQSYPEGMMAATDGTMYAGSLTQGGVFRVAPGAASAERWIAVGANDSMSILGVYPDESSKTLWVCSSDWSALGVPPPAGAKPVALKAFDLASGAPKGSWPLPGGSSMCNDMVVGKDGTVYVTDTLQPHVVALKPGGHALEPWAESPAFAGEGQLDGITIAGDGNMYVNLWSSGKLFRIAMGPDGSAGRITELKLSREIFHPDAMRPFGKNALLLVEGENLDIVRLSGDDANIETVKSGMKGGPCALLQIGSTAWVLEGQQNTLFDAKAGKPGPFKAQAVRLPAE